MRNYSASVVAVRVASLASACSPIPQPAVRAADVERLQCDPDATRQDKLVRSMAVLRVKPIYSPVRSNTSTEERLNGAKLVVRSPSHVSAEQMTRILQCHSARMVLGHLDDSLVPNDPYWLPERWVNIDVKPENGALVVTVSADTIRDNLLVLSRANHYGDDHMPAIARDLH
jgi:hypothetical protein